MPLVLPLKRLIHVGKANKATISAWREGVSLATDARCDVMDLLHRVSADRLQLARAFRRDAAKMLQSDPPLNRSALSRSYYAMYHAMRAAVFIHHLGDDFEGHTKLPTGTPKDFPDKTRWMTDLKNARLMRNSADYDPYPKSDTAWKTDALSLKNQADELILTVRKYLSLKGSVYV